MYRTLENIDFIGLDAPLKVVARKGIEPSKLARFTLAH